MKILMLGPQGCGKGTIGEKLSELFKLPLFSVGQVLRDLPHDSKYYADINAAMHAGSLAPIEEVAEIIKTELKDHKYHEGYIMDGWARQMRDLDVFDPNFDVVILLNISEKVSVERLGGRRTCSSCGKVYNVNSNPSKAEGVCDICGGELVLRDDDTKEAILKRLQIYKKETLPVILKFRNEGKILEINAEPAIEKVFKDTVFGLSRLSVL